MPISPADLMTGEQWLLSKPANAIIRLDEYGLRRMPFNLLLWTVGLKGQEAIGGHLHLTTYRLIFQSHSINRVTGRFSIFLPSIHNLRNNSHLLTRKLGVYTQTTQYEFIVWGIQAFTRAILSARDQLGPAEQATLRLKATEENAKCGDGLHVIWAR